MDDSMWALVVATIYLVPFLAIGLLGKRVLDRWMGRKDLDLSGIGAQMGQGRRKHRAFLLGIWRTEDPDS